MAVIDAAIFKLCDITQRKLNIQNQIIKGFQEYFCYRFSSMLNSSDKQWFPLKLNQIYEKNNLYKMI